MIQLAFSMCNQQTREGSNKEIREMLRNSCLGHSQIHANAFKANRNTNAILHLRKLHLRAGAAIMKVNAAIRSRKRLFLEILLDNF